MLCQVVAEGCDLTQDSGQVTLRYDLAELINTIADINRNPAPLMLFPRKWEFVFPYVIPAKVGIYLPLCHSREGGNPGEWRMGRH